MFAAASTTKTVATANSTKSESLPIARIALAAIPTPSKVTDDFFSPVRRLLAANFLLLSFYCFVVLLGVLFGIFIGRYFFAFRRLLPCHSFFLCRENEIAAIYILYEREISLPIYYMKENFCCLLRRKTFPFVF